MTDKPTGSALKPEDLDRLGQAIMTLTQELWVTKDRQRVLEALLEEAGIVAPGAIDRHAPDTALSEQLDTERRRLIDAVLGTLQPPDDPS